MSPELILPANKFAIQARGSKCTIAMMMMMMMMIIINVKSFLEIPF